MHLAAAAGFSGLGTYLFLALVARSLGEAGYSDFSVFWSLTVIAGLGLFLPIEQETSRLIVSGGSVSGGTRILTAAVVSGLAVSALGLIALVGLAPLMGEVTRDSGSVSLSLLLSFLGYSLQFPVRAILGATHRLSRYALVIAVEGAARLALACAIFVAALDSVLIAGVIVAAAAFASLVLLDRRAVGEGLHLRVEPRQFLAGTGRLIAAGLMFQVLLNLPPILAAAASGDGAPSSGQVLVALTLARIPIFVYQSIQALVLPRLAESWARAEPRFTRAAVGFFGVVTVVVGAWALVMLVFGHLLITWGFGPEFQVSAGVLGTVVLGVSLLTLALVTSDTLLVTGAHSSVIATWSAAAIAAACAILLGLLVPGQATLLPVVLGAGVGLVVAITLLVARIWRSRARP